MSRRHPLFFGAVIAAVALRAGEPLRTFEASAFGARGDGRTVETTALQAAIDAAAQAGGGTVHLGAGTYVSGTLYLKSQVTLALDADATLEASTSRVDYCAADAFPQNYASPRSGDNTSGGHLIVAHDATGVGVRGPGRIDGRAAAFLVDPATGTNWAGWKRGIPWRPGQMLYFVDCRDVTVRDVRLEHSPYWTCYLLNCTAVTVSNCTVRTVRRPFKTWNGDGIDIDRCRDVTVTACDIETEDDAITLRASGERWLRHPQDCTGIRVSDCRLSSACNAVRLGVGNGVVSNAVFRGLRIDTTRVAFNAVGSWARKPEPGVSIYDVAFTDCRVDAEMLFKFYYRTATASVFDGIRFRDIRGRVRAPGVWADTPARPFRNITFDQMDVAGPWRESPPEARQARIVSP
ncbi:MAG: glycoside hydrolase family 28 protein [Kiritimatiellia bacterium]